jgi:hypothetical protein
VGFWSSWEAFTTCQFSEMIVLTLIFLRSA